VINCAGSITAVYVADQERARRFYVNLLGFTELANHENYEPGHSWIEVARKGHEEVSLALLQPGQLGEGHSGIAFVADDVQSTYEALKELGVRFEWEPRKRGWGTDAQFLDRNDNRFLIVDPQYHKRPLDPGPKPD
jgi:lactoylglutathione lyase